MVLLQMPGAVDLELLPEPTLRRLLDVFGLRMRHDKEKGLVECEVTITSEIVGIQRDVANVVIGTGGAGTRSTPYGLDHLPARPTPGVRLTIPFSFFTP